MPQTDHGAVQCQPPASMPASSSAQTPAAGRRESQRGAQNGSSGAKGDHRARTAIPVAVSPRGDSFLRPLMDTMPAFPAISSLRSYLPGATSPPSSSAPTPPSRQGDDPEGSSSRITFSRWQSADVGDGHGTRPLLILSSTTHLVRIYAHHASRISDDSNVEEVVPPPEEIFSLAAIANDDNTHMISRTLHGVKSGEAKFTGLGRGIVLDAVVREKNAGSVVDGPLLYIITSTSTRGSGRKLPAARSRLALFAVDMRTGRPARKLDLGYGNAAKMSLVRNSLIIALSDPEPRLVTIDPTSFSTTSPSVLPSGRLAVDPRTRLPVHAVSGRLIAYVTSDPPRNPGPSGLGTLVTALPSSSTSPHPRTVSNPGGTSSPRPGPTSAPLSGTPSASATTSSAILSSAVNIGGAAARGVWAGIQLGAKAANSARAARLARSAPVERSVLAQPDLKPPDDADVQESRSLDEASALDESMSRGSTALPGEENQSPNPARGLWIKIVDMGRSLDGSSGLGQSPYVEKSQGEAESSALGEDDGVTIAHFRLPPYRSLLPSSGQVSLPSRLSRGIQAPPTSSPAPPPSSAQSESVAYLSWNPDGTQLFAAPAHGRAFHILQVHPVGRSIVAQGSSGGREGERAGSGREGRETMKGEVWHVYELRRGSTGAEVTEVVWAEDGRWIGVGTGRGTMHIYGVHPSGCPASSDTHLSTRMLNPSKLFPPSQSITSIAKLHPPHSSLPPPPAPSSCASHTGPLPASAVSFSFTRLRAYPNSHPAGSGPNGQAFYFDSPAFRPREGVIELGRITLRPAPPARDRTQRAVSAGATAGASVSAGASGLTEMMRRTGSELVHAQGAGGVIAQSEVVARWTLPDPSVDLYLGDNAAGRKRGVSRVNSVRRHNSPLAYAEIRTHSANPRIIPSSIYLSPQITFYSAKAIDAYSPLSIMDPEARVARLTFRAEVVALPSSSAMASETRATDSAAPLAVSESASFDEPLSTALHTRIPSSPSRAEIPGLPNGYPGHPGAGTSWRALPIRQVAHGVTLGVGEGIDIVRKQYIRAQANRRRRRASENQGNALSFEEGTIFASSSSPNGANEVSDAGGDGGGGERGIDVPEGEGDQGGVEGSMGGAMDDAEWGDGWEAEYARAVEDDGGPDDLVLGLMDEEEEERRMAIAAASQGVARSGRRRGGEQRQGGTAGSGLAGMMSESAGVLRQKRR